VTKIRRDLSLIAFDLAGGDREKFSNLQLDRSGVLQISRADLRPGKIDEDRERAFQFQRRCTGTFDVFGVLLVRAVRHVDPNSADTRFDHLFYSCLCV
jgi:hypothetical protein